MALTLDQIAQRVLRNCQIPQDGSTSATTALSDAYNYINERARDVWKRRLWREYIILGTYTVPAGQQTVALNQIAVHPSFANTGNGYNAAFYEVAAVRNGSDPLTAEDPSAINLVRADLWESTSSPVKFVGRGQTGIFLLGSYQTATTISFFGKAAYQPLTANETWIMDNENCLIAGATGDMIRDNDRDDNRAGIRYQEFEAEIAKLIDAQEIQGANLKRIIPIAPWTDFNNPNLVDISKTGFAPYNI